MFNICLAMNISVIPAKIPRRNRSYTAWYSQKEECDWGGGGLLYVACRKRGCGLTHSRHGWLRKGSNFKVFGKISCSSRRAVGNKPATDEIAGLGVFDPLQNNSGLRGALNGCQGLGGCVWLAPRQMFCYCFCSYECINYLERRMQCGLPY